MPPTNPIVNFGAFNQDAAAQVLAQLGSFYSTTILLNATLPVGALTGGATIYLRCTANGANALTTRTAAQMYADLAAAIGFNPPPNYSYEVNIVSAGNNTVTLTAGTGVTITGTTTIATGASRTYVVTVNSPSSVVFQDASN